MPLFTPTLSWFNLIINPSALIRQRGTSFASGAIQYTLDRWKFRRKNATANATVTRTTGFSGSQFCARVSRDVGNAVTDDLYYVQQIETINCYQVQGQPAFYVGADLRCGANFSDAASSVICTVFTGTGSNETVNPETGFATGNVTTAIAKVISTTAQRQVFGPFNIPSNATEIAVMFSFTPVGVAGAADYFEVVRVSAGNLFSALNFYERPITQELEFCQRYFDMNFPQGTTPVQNLGSGLYQFAAQIAGAASQRSSNIPFRVTMRTNPTITLYNPNAANAQVRDAIAAADCSSSTVVLNSSNSAFCVNCTGAAGTAVGNSLQVNWTADAEIGP